MDTIADLGNKLESNGKLLKSLHKLIISAPSDSEEISFRIFPVYINYYRGDRTVAILYFRGKLAATGISIGLNLSSVKSALLKNVDVQKIPKDPNLTHLIAIRKESNIVGIRRIVGVATR